MRKIELALMVIATGMLLLTSCKNQPNGNNSDAADKQEVKGSANANAKKVQEEDEAGLGSDYTLVSVIKTWRNKPIEVSSENPQPGIKEFAKAFCSTYQEFEPNKAVCDYFSIGDYKGENYSYHFDYQPKNGYLYAMQEVQFSDEIECCYWKRKDGHILVIFNMTETVENQEGMNLLACYDYDSEKSVLTPEPAIAEMVEKEMKSFDDYAVKLPSDGKDIQVAGYIIDKEEDSAKMEDFLLKWNGHSFDFQK